VDATLAWTVVGSAAGVAGVTVAAIATVMQARSGRKLSSRVTAELGSGQIDQHGVLYVQFASGKTDVMTLPEPTDASVEADRATNEKTKDSLEFNPVNAIFVHNQGLTAVTVSRCHYVSHFGDVEFKFEPQSAASPRGDRLPKRLEPGEDAVLIHDLMSMRVFLNGVLRDHAVDDAVFKVMLTLGDGDKVVASSFIRVQADMSEREMAATGTRLIRTEMIGQPTLAGRMRFERRRWRRRAHGA
jgi:hypothetical protein